MTIRDKVIFALTTSGAMCDDCLSSLAGVKPRQAVNACCRELSFQGQLVRTQDQCPRCRASKIINFLGKTSHNNTVRATSTTSTSQTTSKNSKPWYWEGNVQDKITDHLRATGWNIISSANTESREAGKDIIAKKDTDELWISVKGWPEKSQNMQARHWFSGALFDLVLYRSANPGVRLAIGLPGGFTTYENLIPRVSWLREKLPFDVYLVSQSGEVSVIVSNV